jgi:uncharacterized protein (TIGR02996 family)
LFLSLIRIRYFETRSMSASREAFLQAICESPDDDTARLVFADWLDEHDDPERAEYIRLQVGLASGTVANAPEAQARADELFKRNETAWRRELPTRPGVTWAATPFARGFAECAAFRHGKAWKEHSPVAFAAAPISRVRCGGTFTAKTARAILGSPFVGRLAELSGIHIDEEGARILADNPHFSGRLRELNISGAENGDGAAAVLGRIPGLRNLETLSPGQLGPKGVAALVGSQRLSRLKNLHFGTSTIGDEAAEAIAASPHLPALEHVLLNYTGIGDRGAVALAQSARLASLRELYLGGRNPITDAGALKIASSTGLPRLAELHLWGSQITDGGARALADFAERRGLAVLNLRSCELSAGVLTELRARLGSRFCP